MLDEVPRDNEIELKGQQGRLLARMFDIHSDPSCMEQYTLLDCIGHGGMGVVYAAYDRNLDRKVAIKKMLTPRDISGRKRFVREAKAMAKLAHPNVVQIHNIDEHEGAPFIVMEFVDGVTLRQWLRTPRTNTEILAAFVAAGRGLAAAHQVGLVHRDFKPDNVMIRADGRVLVMDFGLALVNLDETMPESAPSKPAGELGFTPGIMGTPGYMAPEQWMGARVTPQADQFSFCVALWEALCGERPFVGSNPEEIMLEAAKGVIPTPSHRVMNKWIREILARGLRTTPGRRFRSMDALLDALTGDPVIRRRRLLPMGFSGLALGLRRNWARRPASSEAKPRESRLNQLA